jgi:small conductance mechanosensitive channel
MDTINLKPEELAEKMTIVQDNMPLYIDMAMNLVSAILILIAGWVIGNWISKRITNIKKLDKTLTTFLGGFAKYTVLSVAIVAVLGQFGVQTASLLAVLGAAGLAIGLALQGTLSNVAAGTMLLILRPFKVGDYITIGSVGGTVKALGLFGSELATPDNVYIFVPNSHLWNSDIYNYSRHGTRRHDLIVGISYNDDIDKAFKTKKDDRIITEEDKTPQIMVDNMGDFSIDIRVRFWCKSEDYWALKWDITKEIKEALDKSGITIPFPTRTIEMVSEEVKSKSKKAA